MSNIFAFFFSCLRSYFFWHHSSTISLQILFRPSDSWFEVIMSTPPFVSYASELFSVPPETFRKAKLRLPLTADDEQKLSTALDRLISRSAIFAADRDSDQARSLVLHKYRYPLSDLQLSVPLNKLVALTFLSVKQQVFQVRTLLLPRYFSSFSFLFIVCF